MADDEKRYGDVATKLLFENDRVKIWEMRLDPGEEGALHEHTLDHVLVQISGDRMAVVPDPNSRSVYNEYLEADVAPGKHFFIERGGIEVARNVGKQPFHEIVIELKD